MKVYEHLWTNWGTSWSATDLNYKTNKNLIKLIKLQSMKLYLLRSVPVYLISICLRFCSSWFLSSSRRRSSSWRRMRSGVLKKTFSCIIRHLKRWTWAGLTALPLWIHCATLSHHHELVFVFRGLHLGLQLLFRLLNVSVHLISLLFLHLIQRFPSCWILKLESARLGKTGRLLPFPRRSGRVWWAQVGLANIKNKAVPVRKKVFIVSFASFLKIKGQLLLLYRRALKINQLLVTYLWYCGVFCNSFSGRPSSSSYCSVGSTITGRGDLFIF